MACPDQKAKHTGRAIGGSGVPLLVENLIRVGGLRWKPVSGQPQEGELYCFPDIRMPKKDAFFGVLEHLTPQRDGSWFFSALNGNKYYSHNTAHFGGWYELADRGEPDWESPPVEAAVKDFQAIAAQGYLHPLVSVGAEGWRKNFTSGAYAIIRPGLLPGEYVACAFRLDGRRISGVAAKAGNPDDAAMLLGLVAGNWLLARRKKKTFDYSPGEALAGPFCGGPERLAVQRALAAGEEVPLETLLQYPDLMTTYGV